MASLLRTAAKQGSRVLLSTIRGRPTVQPLCCISTSKKNKDSATTTETPSPSQFEKKEEGTENYISWGFSTADKEDDDYFNTSVIRVGTFAIIWMCFIVAYFPDWRLKDWSVREAYLELARREKEGLPLIDPNLVDPAQIDLPSDEDLVDTEIII